MLAETAFDNLQTEKIDLSLDRLTWIYILMTVSALAWALKKGCSRVHCFQTSIESVDQTQCPCFILADGWPGNLEVLYQHFITILLPFVSVNTCNCWGWITHLHASSLHLAPADVHTNLTSQAMKKMTMTIQGRDLSGDDCWKTILFTQKEPQDPVNNVPLVLNAFVC